MMSNARKAAGASRFRTVPSAAELAVRLLPFVLLLYPLLGAAAGRSEVRVVFGRYSVLLTAMLTACCATVALGFYAVRRGWLRLEQLTVIAISVIAYLLPGSNQVQALAGIGLVLPALRVAGAVALCTVEARHARGRDGKASGFLAVGIVLGLFAIVDLGIALATRGRLVPAQAGEGEFRVRYDMSALADDGVVLIGDSFVWGAGVSVESRFGDLLQGAYRAAGTPRPVYSLGLIGAGLSGYLRALALVPARSRSGRIVLAYYMNDIPPRALFAQRIRDHFTALGVGAPTLRVVGDTVGRAMTPTVDSYHESVVGDYDERDPSFRGRVALLEADVAKFRELASARSDRAPVLLIIPIMVNFERYPLEEGHRRVRELGKRLGYQVVDLLPVFREKLRDGRDHWAAANDNHFDAESHAIVAQILRDAL